MGLFQQKLCSHSRGRYTPKHTKPVRPDGSFYATTLAPPGRNRPCSCALKFHRESQSGPSTISNVTRHQKRVRFGLEQLGHCVTAAPRRRFFTASPHPHAAMLPFTNGYLLNVPRFNRIASHLENECILTFHHGNFCSISLRRL